MLSNNLEFKESEVSNDTLILVNGSIVGDFNTDGRVRFFGSSTSITLLAYENLKDICNKIEENIRIQIENDWNECDDWQENEAFFDDLGEDEEEDFVFDPDDTFF
jgi:hypothetical protein